MTDVEKIGTVELATIRTHARALYFPLDATLVRTYGLKKGDVLKVKILMVFRDAVEKEE